MVEEAEFELNKDLLIIDESQSANKIRFNSNRYEKNSSDLEAPLVSQKNLENFDLSKLPIYEQKKRVQQENNKRALRKLIWVVLITLVFVAVEIIGGLMANSIAILSDAAHLTSDALGISISIVALKIAERNANSNQTYGYHRAEVLGALVSILFIWAVTIWLMIEATQRIMNPVTIRSEIMLIVSGMCLVFNLIQMSILHSKDMHDFAHAPGQSCGHDHGPDGHHHSHDHSDPNHKCSHSHSGDTQKQQDPNHQCSHNHSETKSSSLDQQNLNQKHNHSDPNHKCSHDHSEVKPKHDHSDPNKKCSHSHSEAKQNHDHSDPNHKCSHSQTEVKPKHDHSDPNHKCTHSHSEIMQKHDHSDPNHKCSHKHDEPQIKTTRQSQPIIQVTKINPSFVSQTGSFISQIESTDCNNKDDVPNFQYGNEEIDDVSTVDSEASFKPQPPRRNLNVEAAYLHILGDIINSVGVLIASLIIYFTDGRMWYFDPICTYIFGILVFYTTRITFSYCMQMLMETTPTEIDHNYLYKTLSEIKYVHNVHDLHVWSLSDGKMAMTVHLVVLAKNQVKNERVLNRCDDVLRSAFRLNHFSIQIETEKYKCGNDLHD